MMIMPPLLSRLPTTDPNTGDLLVVIETPKDSPNKYDYDDTCGAFRLAEVMPKGSYFPYDFGFIPSTVGDDGDPLDVLVFMDDSAPVGCVLTIRLIGAIEAKQREKGGDWERNDRLLAVASHAHTHAHIAELDDLRPHLLDEIEAFFAHYNQQKGKAFKVLSRCGPKKARKIIDHGMAVFLKKYSNGDEKAA
jgi:inorganic pyrophosphatase